MELINKVIYREKLKNEIKNVINEINNNLNNISSKKVIYIMGPPGSGKTYFVREILEEINYDIINFDTEQNRNTSNFDFVKSFNMSSVNVLDLMHGKKKKICIVMDNLESLNTSDKSGLAHLIKLLRPKKTTKQKKEDFSKNLIICISDISKDKKILELRKNCFNFDLQLPNLKEMKLLIHSMMRTTPSLELEDQLIKYINYDLRKFSIVNDIYKNVPDYDKFNNVILDLVQNNDHSDAKTITADLIKNKISFRMHDQVISDSDRTIVSLLLHENIVDFLPSDKDIAIKLYTQILDNFATGDFYDKITFQKQIWLFNELTSLMKNIHSNHIFQENVEIDEVKEVRFTKILTKYSTEFNNINFIIKFCQKLAMDKKDLINFFFEKHKLLKEEDYLYLEERFDIKKLDVNRLIRYIENKTSKETIEEDLDE